MSEIDILNKNISDSDINNETLNKITEYIQKYKIKED
jgi:hypothetical protein